MILAWLGFSVPISAIPCPQTFNRFFIRDCFPDAADCSKEIRLRTEYPQCLPQLFKESARIYGARSISGDFWRATYWALVSSPFWLCLLSRVRGQIRFEAAPLVAAFLPLTGLRFTSIAVVIEEG